MERVLVGEIAAENRLRGLDLGVEAAEARRQLLPDPSPDADLVPVGHRGTVAAVGVTTPHPR